MGNSSMSEAIQRDHLPLFIILKARYVFKHTSANRALKKASRILPRPFAGRFPLLHLFLEFYHTSRTHALKLWVLAFFLCPDLLPMSARPLTNPLGRPSSGPRGWLLIPPSARPPAHALVDAGGQTTDQEEMNDLMGTGLVG